MSFSRQNLTFMVAWGFFWLLMALVEVQDYLRNGGDEIWKPVLWEGSSAVVATALALLQRRITRRHDQLLGRPWRWFLLQAMWLPLYLAMFTPLTFGIRHAVYALAGQTYRHDPWGRLFVYESLKITIFISLFTAILFGIKSWRALVDARLRAERANVLLRQAQLQQLAQQMQPHFLFNALNTISSLMHSDVDKADATLMQLAGVLRTTLALGQQQEAPLATELALAQGYAGVMGERFAGRVEIAWDVDDSLATVPLPVISVQPLLENVFKHTVEQRRGLTRIVVRAVRDGAAMLLSIEDDAGQLVASANPGISLANLRARLAALHGEAAALSLHACEGGGVRTELRVPCAALVELPCAS